MKSDQIRLITTIVIWGTVAGMVIAGGLATGQIVPLTIVLGIGATLSTGFVWMSAGSARAEEETSKAKRTDRVSRLVDNLEEDEVLELAELLEARREDRLQQ